MKKFIRLLSKTAMILAFLAMAVFTASSVSQKVQGAKIPMICGWGNALVLTGSMEPTIPARSWVIIHATDELEVGDVISYQEADTQMPVTHRIRQISGNYIITQGDANNASDNPITFDAVIGKVVLVLPPAIFPLMILFLIAVSAILVITETIQKTTQWKRKEERNRGICE